VARRRAADNAHTSRIFGGRGDSTRAPVRGTGSGSSRMVLAAYDDWTQSFAAHISRGSSRGRGQHQPWLPPDVLPDFPPPSPVSPRPAVRDSLAARAVQRRHSVSSIGSTLNLSSSSVISVASRSPSPSPARSIGTGADARLPRHRRGGSGGSASRSPSAASRRSERARAAALVNLGASGDDDVESIVREYMGWTQADSDTGSRPRQRGGAAHASAANRRGERTGTGSAAGTMNHSAVTHGSWDSAVDIAELERALGLATADSFDDSDTGVASVAKRASSVRSAASATRNEGSSPGVQFDNGAATGAGNLKLAGNGANGSAGSHGRRSVGSPSVTSPRDASSAAATSSFFAVPLPPDATPPSRGVHRGSTTSRVALVSLPGEYAGSAGSAGRSRRAQAAVSGGAGSQARKSRSDGVTSPAHSPGTSSAATGSLSRVHIDEPLPSWVPVHRARQ
jgi:hypothetical protein